jgi:hypothetical protein
VYRTHRLIRTTHIFKYINSTSVTIAVICTVYIFPYITIPLHNQTVQRTHIHTIHERNRILQGFRIRGGNKGYEQEKNNYMQGHEGTHYARFSSSLDPSNRGSVRFEIKVSDQFQIGSNSRFEPYRS